MKKKTAATTKQRLDRFDERMGAIVMNLELVSMAQERTAQELSQMAKLAKTILTSHNKRITRLEKRPSR